MSLPPYLIWMIVAAACIVLEIFTAGFFLLWIGIGAAVAGGLALLGLGFIWQWSAFVLISLLLFLGSRRFVRCFTQGQPSGVGADRYVDAQGFVLEDVHNARATGRVRLGSETWRAISDDGSIISTGSEVIVVRVEGTALVVASQRTGTVKETR